MATRVLREFKGHSHQHAQCIAHAVAQAEAACRRRGQRFTRLRRRVLELVWESHEPVKAYDLLDRLRGERARAAPPTVYRALDFLQAEGLVHRIASLNAFVGCGEPGWTHRGQFLICRECGTVAEIDDPELLGVIAARAGQLGFAVDHEIIEIAGVCGNCRA